MNIPGRPLLFVLTCLISLLLCADGAFAQKKKKQGLHTVVIDPGHGGNDPGAIYGGINEKDVNLKVAFKLGKLITDNCPDVQVIYTRSKDVFIGLAERGDIANKAGANLFISIHANAADNRSARGAETFVMGMERNESNLKEAMRENAVIKLEKDYSEKYEGFDPSSAESYIIFSLMQHAYLNQSIQFAQTVQKHYKLNTPMNDRGARQRPYLVLWKTAMPSVLTEMGFLSNESDRKYLSSDKGQNEIAKALFDAFREYKQAVDKKEMAAGSNGSASSAAAQPDKETAKPAAAPAPADKKPEPAAKEAPQTKPETAAKASQGSTSGVGFYVQLCASRTRIPTGDVRFGTHRGKVVEKQVDGWYKYYLGGYTRLDDAVAARDAVRKGSFKDAFVIAFDGDRQVTIDEARRRIAGKQ